MRESDIVYADGWSGGVGTELVDLTNSSPLLYFARPFRPERRKAS